MRTADPIDAIRELESATHRKLSRARENATRTLAEANEQAARIVEEGRRRGEEAARQRFASGLAEAKRRADDIRKQAEVEAARLSLDVTRAVARMLRFVLPTDEGTS